MGHCVGNERLHLIHLTLIAERADLRCGIESVSDHQRFGRSHEALGERSVACALHQEPG